MWIKIGINNKIILFGTIYRLPNTDFGSFLEYFKNFLATIYTDYDRIVCGGDFNVDLLNPTDTKVGKLESMMDSFSLKQVISEPTRVSATSCTLIDLIFTNIDLVSEAVVHTSQLSDHFPVPSYENNIGFT